MPDTFNPDLSTATTAHADLLSPEEAARAADIHSAANGVRYSTFGSLDATHTAPAELARMVGTVPATLAGALSNHVYAFVPLALSAARLAGDDSTESAFSPADKTLIAARPTHTLAEKATCHRNAPVGGAEHVFLSARLHPDRFALAFEFFINIAHNFVDVTGGLPSGFADLVWAQALSSVRGETSIDAWEHRADALGQPAPSGSSRSQRRSEPSRAANITGRPLIDEKARTAYVETAFSDTLAIYLLSLFLDFDYADLRERDYPLLAPSALAERLRFMNRIFPANAGYDFAIRYRRKG